MKIICNTYVLHLVIFSVMYVFVKVIEDIVIKLILNYMELNYVMLTITIV